MEFKKKKKWVNLSQDRSPRRNKRLATGSDHREAGCHIRKAPRHQPPGRQRNTWELRFPPQATKEVCEKLVDKGHQEPTGITKQGKAASPLRHIRWQRANFAPIPSQVLPRYLEKSGNALLQQPSSWRASTVCQGYVWHLQDEKKNTPLGAKSLLGKELHLTEKAKLQPH